MNTPSKQEWFEIPSRRLTDAEMRNKAFWVAHYAKEVYSEDPGVYKDFNMFLGFRIGVESIHYVLQGDREDMERFATLVMGFAL